MEIIRTIKLKQEQCFFVENEILRMSPENVERKKLAEKKWLK